MLVISATGSDQHGQITDHGLITWSDQHGQVGTFMIIGHLTTSDAILDSGAQRVFRIQTCSSGQVPLPPILTLKLMLHRV